MVVLMGELRLVSGIYRGRKLETLEGDATRPLLTRLRKSLVDVLRPNLRGARVADLFGGSGAIGFELLSGGADKALFVEMNATAAHLIEDNAKLLGAEVRVINGDTLNVIPRISKTSERFDIVIIAPPYFKELHLEVMALFEEHPIFSDEAIIVVQRDTKEPFYEVPKGSQIEFTRTRKYGRTVFDYYEVHK